jgi:uncharacterized RDD family membrane protein YckC
MSSAAVSEPGRLSRRSRMLLTPEGVPLRIELAEPGERLAAFMVDLIVTTAAALLLRIAAFLLPHGDFVGFTLPLMLFLAFLVQNAYFIYFELRWAGATPGKRMLGLRVINRHGGPLSASAVVARNLTRQAEIFFPLELLLATHGWFWTFGEVMPVLIWGGAMLGLVLGTSERLRLGDLIAGTVVISIPERLLLEDLSRSARLSRFSAAQLEKYGIRELQVLEDVLRRPPSAETDQLMRDVCDRIQRRIGWERAASSENAEDFLREFYTAQREFLERKKNLGEERRDKFSLR